MKKESFLKIYRASGSGRQETMLRDIYISTIFVVLLLSVDALAFSGIMAVANRLFGIDWISWENICFSARVSGAIAFIFLPFCSLEFARIRSEIRAKGEYT